MDGGFTRRKISRIWPLILSQRISRRSWGDAADQIVSYRRQMCPVLHIENDPGEPFNDYFFGVTIIVPTFGCMYCALLERYTQAFGKTNAGAWQDPRWT